MNGSRRRRTRTIWRPCARCSSICASFLWVSDGQSFWGRDAVLARMASFQKAEVWRVEPDLARAVPVVVSPGVAYLHLPLVLVIGPERQPDRLHFLVSMLGVDSGQGWRIAALFTATQKNP